MIPWHQVLARGIDDTCISRRFEILADGRDLSFTDENIGVWQSTVCDSDHPWRCESKSQTGSLRGTVGLSLPDSAVQRSSMKAEAIV